jgi:hypothetical protein
MIRLSITDAVTAALTPCWILKPASEVDVPFPEALAETVAIGIPVLPLVVVVSVVVPLAVELGFPVGVAETTALSAKRASKEGSSTPTTEHTPLA